MIEPLIVVEENRALAAHFGDAKPLTAASPKAVQAAMNKFAQGALWVGRTAPMMKWLGAFDTLTKTRHRLLLIGNAKAPERAFLRAVFESVVAPDDDMRLLGLDQLFDVLGSSNRSNLFIAGAVAPAAKSLVLIRGNLESVVVPLSLFVPRPNGPKPDLSDFEVIDSGQTIRLGKYEAAADAVLYELDPEFRRLEKKRRISEDTSLGGALRRLRLQRGLGREAFPGITAKTIARIERGEVKEPHSDTLATIANTLGVKPEDIATF
jgi:Helix-turn-helix domain